LPKKGQRDSDQRPNAGRASNNDNVKTDHAISKQNVDSVNIANPSNGVGMFRDPLEILGSYNLQQRVPILF